MYNSTFPNFKIMIHTNFIHLSSIQVWCAAKFFVIQVFSLNVVLNRAKSENGSFHRYYRCSPNYIKLSSPLARAGLRTTTIKSFKAIPSDANFFAIRKNT